MKLIAYLFLVAVALSSYRSEKPQSASLESNLQMVSLKMGSDAMRTAANEALTAANYGSATFTVSDKVTTRCAPNDAPLPGVSFSGEAVLGMLTTEELDRVEQQMRTTWETSGLEVTEKEDQLTAENPTGNWSLQLSTHVGSASTDIILKGSGVAAESPIPAPYHLETLLCG